MHLQNGVNPLVEKQDMDHHQLSTSRMRRTNTGSTCNEGPSWSYIGAATDTKQRKSLMGRLVTVGPVSRAHPRPLSLASLAVTEPFSRPTSYDWRDNPTFSPYDRPESAARAILSRGGRMLRRHGSKFSLSSFIPEEESGNGNMEVSETCQRPQQSPKKAKSPGRDLRRAISHPFDFHHVTHTRPRHFERLEEGSQNELISEFMAIRAAQRPQSTLQGIQVNDLGNTPSVKKPSAETRRHPSKVGNIPSPEGHLNFPVSAQTPPSSPRSPRGIRSSPSIENFSRPAPWSPTSPTSPPPRTSSRYALNYSRPAGKAKSKPAKQASGKPRCVPHGDKNSFLDFDRPTNEPHLAVTHAITTIDGSARSLKYTSLPPVSYDGGMDSGPTADLHHGVEQGIPSDVVSSTDLPLRHANSFATTRTVSRPGLDKFSSNDQIADKARPESPQPARTSRWEDVVDYCYEQAAEADCNFDWSQKTVYVDGDLESTDAPASEGHPVETLASPTDEQQNSPGNCESKPCARAFHLRGVPAGNKLYSRHTSKKSVTELEDCLSPFGRHQSSSEYRGYQHLPQTSSKHISNLYTARKDVSVDHHAYIQEQDDDDAELKLPVEHPTTLERCSSGGSTSFSGLRPLSNKYSSDGSLLSSTTSTIRTYRSSTSVGSLPELVHSHNNSQESVMVGRTSSTDSVSSVLQSIPSRATSAPQSPPVLDRANAESQQIACLSQVISSRVAASEVSSTASSTAPVSPAGLKETPCELAGKRVRAGSDKAKPKDVSIRKRSASAVTPGQRPPTRGSYSLFPNQQSLNRRA